MNTIGRNCDNIVKADPRHGLLKWRLKWWGVTAEMVRGKSNNACGINTLCTPYPNRPTKRDTYPFLPVTDFRIRLLKRILNWIIEMDDWNDWTGLMIWQVLANTVIHSLKPAVETEYWNDHWNKYWKDKLWENKLLRSWK